MKFLILTLLAITILSVSAINTAFAWEQRLTIGVDDNDRDTIYFEFYDTEYDFIDFTYEYIPTPFYELLFKTDSPKLNSFIDSLEIGHKLNSINVAESPSTPEHESGYYEIRALEDCIITDTPPVNSNYADFALVVEC